MIQTAQSLRLVRQARLAFLMNWSQDEAALSHLPGRLADLLPPADDEKRDWRHLYDGSVLDD